MKSYVTEGTGSQQTLRNSQDNKVPIYDSLADAEADLSNLKVGQIVATKDTGDELPQPVDVVEEGNLHAVSSNAVAESGKLSELVTATEANISSGDTMPYDGFIIAYYAWRTASNNWVKRNNILIGFTSGSNTDRHNGSYTIPFNKGDVIEWDLQNEEVYFCFYESRR